ncbi:CocE/NonD family hydrolase [Mycobacterium paragordonae]|jgi:predicted acyl esterase|uniref:CocE/NonD family hydrolase n=1 Tax=Mycobacterium paragordonae TaxID=1389713 RepID=A0A4R5WF28_9MYCO|nr:MULTISPECIES: CocE/NonD family hydrolase [Mycobacterium]MDP7738691.1 CocE/NonD family hydrolase [Mycobacterium paragordonae]OBK50083.1 peptidase S15 [Mycobacterium gordonae]TDK87821.1 CocE/NonD family hydrolase [Mycobacterium paragordonae]TDK89714.1 CocE/NonD family hydrolase [Mycobacterium paragordonae]TDL02052.1 CocE/NonD family hydrolase [Mycobacterium paragordonae]
MTNALNGPQTTGRAYRNLSEPQHRRRRENNVPVAMRDGVTLLADVHRPDAQGRFPALLAASPYPRQMQDFGAPAGFIEAGVTDFWVPRGYAHVIANVRGTCGSGGTFGFFDAQERRDMYDLVEWVAAQPWCDGNVGMIGISYFAMSQLEAAVERPPHLNAIFPVAGTADLYEAASHHGLFSSSFVTPFLAMTGLTSERSDKLWRSLPVGLARRVLHTPRLHKKFATMNGESAVTMLRQLIKLPHNPHPWDELWLDAAVNHPTHDEWWDQRNLLPLLKEIDIPVYLGCDWENVPLHLPSTFAAWKGLSDNACVRMGMLDKFGLTWPWESMHTEALAWYDHWLKGRDTGILEGPPVRYFLPEAGEWRTAESWPPPEAAPREFALRADGVLSADEGEPGSRDYLVLGAGLGRAKPSAIDPPALLTWTTAPLTEDLDLAGEFELRLVASATAIDTAWMVTLQDVAPDGEIADVTAGWLRASLREIDEAASRPGAPVLPCRNPQAVPIGQDVEYRIPLVPNARRLQSGHRIRLVLTSDDQDPSTPAIMDFRHASVGTSSRNTVRSSSRLLVPVLNY